MNTVRIVTDPSLRDESAVAEAVAPGDLTKVWIEKDRTTVPAVPRPRRRLLAVCLLSLAIGGVAGWVFREIAPYGAQLVHGSVERMPRRADVDAPAGLVSTAAAEKAEPKPEKPAPAKTPTAKKKNVSKTDVEIETTFRSDA